MFKVILLFGAPGSGKGTQGKFLGRRKEFVHFSSGYMLRNLANDSIGKKVKKIIGKGELIDDNLLISLFEKSIKKISCEYIVLDGLPRTIKQAKKLEKIMDVKKIIYIDANKENLVKRLLKRAKIEKREDDKEEVIRKRISSYERNTRKVLDYYDKSLIVKVNGNLSIGKVREKIKKIVDGIK